MLFQSYFDVVSVLGHLKSQNTSKFPVSVYYISIITRGVSSLRNIIIKFIKTKSMSDSIVIDQVNLLHQIHVLPDVSPRVLDYRLLVMIFLIPVLILLLNTACDVE
ncbi:hypothetical protein RclHR1_01100031 [Rhizophagus clarus]|uniref:Uncharacterized protein n=1 Tax=Rhizophagus clarus TaxID=94130 RepID=A0A2Z6QFD6_9GLOM|nr:hypothetical protein RclHR1_01100031 [Rhizophagus clarus]